MEMESRNCTDKKKNGLTKVFLAPVWLFLSRS